MDMSSLLLINTFLKQRIDLEVTRSTSWSCSDNFQCLFSSVLTVGKVGDGYCGTPGLILGRQMDVINQIKRLFQKEGKQRGIA